MVTREQLLALGFTDEAIRWRFREGRLFRVYPGVYSVGPEPSRLGRFSAAVLACGPDAALSHGSAAGLWGVRRERERVVHVSVPAERNPRHRGIKAHRRAHLVEVTDHERIRTTTVAATLVDLALSLTRDELESAINEADVLGLIKVDQLRAELDAMEPRPGLAKLRATLDRRTYRFTRSGLERSFLRICRLAGLSPPLTRQRVNGYEVDFFWPALGLVVETDGNRYHRTPARQASDRRRDQAHTAAGLTVLRFTEEQIRYEPASVVATLAAVAGRLALAKAA